MTYQLQYETRVSPDPWSAMSLLVRSPIDYTFHPFDGIHLGVISVLYGVLFILVVLKYARIWILIVSIALDCLVFIHLAFR